MLESKNQMLFCLLIIIVILLVCAVYNEPQTVCTESKKQNIQFDSENITISPELYREMVKIVSSYSMLSQDQGKKQVLIYLSTFHLFDMNFSYKSVKKLDESLKSYPYVPGKVEYPIGNMHHNLQKTIITHITQHIEASDKRLTNTNDDKKMIDDYLSRLFKNIKVM